MAIAADDGDGAWPLYREVDAERGTVHLVPSSRAARTTPTIVSLVIDANR
jgi:hypothetical protein